MAERRERERQRSSGGERENGRNELGGPSNGKKWDPQKIELGFESGLDSKTV